MSEGSEDVGPSFKHDCDKCLFLGHYDGHDLYYCAQQLTPTVIARRFVA